MVTPEMENIILKYISSNATAWELDKLSDWILVGDNEKIFDKYVRLHFGIITSINEPDSDTIKKHLLRKIKRDKYRKRVLGTMKYAAVGILFLISGYYFNQERQAISPQGLIPKETAITITLDNGEVKTLGLDENKNLEDAEGNVIGTHNRSGLIYKGGDKGGQLVYNTLNVPYGKQFEVVLSDGTQVFLNSGSTLRYPVSFLEGKDREVFLTGEAYFEVNRDERHPFMVNANEMQVEVLGTKFNVSHYPEDSNINTVLVEGAVQLRIKGDNYRDLKPTLLEPGNKAEWHINSIEVLVEQVDTSLYTAWVQGKLVFRNTSFRQIRQALERRYNVVIKNDNEQLDEQLFDATFDIETIEQVLESFNKSYAIEYSIVENEVIIK